jgi:hypothetical protein
MKRQERQAPEPLTASAPVSTGSNHRAPLSVSRCVPTSTDANGTTWGELFRTVPDAEQEQLLALARRQGLLYLHQLPPHGNGTATAKSAEPNETDQLLAVLLSGQTNALEVVRARRMAAIDPGLDAIQREAVAQALSTPDVFLLAGLPGTGKSRVVAEILTQAAVRGERVLFVAPTSAAIDGVLEQVAARDVFCAVRVSDPKEPRERLTEALRKLAFGERVRAVHAGAVQGAREALREAQERLRRRHEEGALWSRLRELADQAQKLDQELQTVLERSTKIPAEVERAGQAFAANPDAAVAAGVWSDLQTLQQTHSLDLEGVNSALALAKQKRAAAEQEIAALSGQVESLKPLAQAKNQGRWWSLSWWRAAFRGDVARRLADLQAQLQAAPANLRAREQEAADLRQRHATLETSFQAECQTLLDHEIARRRTELLDQYAPVRQHHDRLTAESSDLAARLEFEADRPTAATPEAVEAAAQRWQARRCQDEAALQLAQRWVGFLQDASEAFAERLPGLANLVAGTFQAVAGDKRFDQQSLDAPFDLLVLEQAEEISEADFQALARRARRWVLVGKPTWETAGPSSGPARQAAPRPGLFQRLWHNLHTDPARLPYSWVKEGQCLCCKLRPVSPGQRRWLESERLADFPQIELRILAPPRTSPTLAEVVFPASWTLAQAKEFIFRELEELPLQTISRHLSWVEESDRLLVNLFNAQSDQRTAVTLGDGVREWLAPRPLSASDGGVWFSCQLEFDRSAGWDQDRVEGWLFKYLRVRDLGRTVYLQLPYRMKPDLYTSLSNGGHVVRGAESRSIPGVP